MSFSDYTQRAAARNISGGIIGEPMTPPLSPGGPYWSPLHVALAGKTDSPPPWQPIKISSYEPPAKAKKPASSDWSFSFQPWVPPHSDPPLQKTETAVPSPPPRPSRPLTAEEQEGAEYVAMGLMFIMSAPILAYSLAHFAYTVRDEFTTAVFGLAASAAVYKAASDFDWKMPTKVIATSLSVVGTGIATYFVATNKLPEGTICHQVWRHGATIVTGIGATASAYISGRDYAQNRLDWKTGLKCGAIAAVTSGIVAGNLWANGAFNHPKQSAETKMAQPLQKAAEPDHAYTANSAKEADKPVIANAAPSTPTPEVIAPPVPVITASAPVKSLPASITAYVTTNGLRARNAPNGTVSGSFKCGDGVQTAKGITPGWTEIISSGKDHTYVFSKFLSLTKPSEQECQLLSTPVRRVGPPLSLTSEYSYR